MNLLVVNVHFDPNSFGGATVVAEQLVSELITECEYRVTVVTTHADFNHPEGVIERYSSATGAEVFSINLLSSRDRSADGVSANEDFMHSLELCLAGSSFDLVHIHCVQGMDLQLFEWLRPMSTRLLLTIHDCWWQCEKQFMIDRAGVYCAQEVVKPNVCESRCFLDRKRLDRRQSKIDQALRNVDLFLAPSDFHREFLTKNGFPQSSIRTNKNGVRAPAKTDKKPQAVMTALNFAFLGGPGAIKGFDLIRSVFSSLEQKNYKLTLVDAAKNLGQSWMHGLDFSCKGELEIVAPFKQTDIDEFFNDIDVLLFPSQWKESFGLVVREATIRGIWVIATDCGGPAEDLVDGVNASIIPLTQDPSHLEIAVSRLLADPRPVQQLRERHDVKTCGIRTVKDQALELNDIFLELLSMDGDFRERTV